MKELNYCNECDTKLSTLEKEHNKDCRIDYEEWMCGSCENESDPEELE